MVTTTQREIYRQKRTASLNIQPHTALLRHKHQPECSFPYSNNFTSMKKHLSTHNIADNVQKEYVFKDIRMKLDRAKSEGIFVEKYRLLELGVQVWY